MRWAVAESSGGACCLAAARPVALPECVDAFNAESVGDVLPRVAVCSGLLDQGSHLGGVVPLRQDAHSGDGVKDRQISDRSGDHLIEVGGGLNTNPGPAPSLSGHAHRGYREFQPMSIVTHQ